MLRFSSNSKLEKISKSVPGIVELVISHECPGRVQWQGTTWPARLFNSQDTLVPGERVRVVTMQNITLLVAPLQTSSVLEDHLNARLKADRN